MMDTVRRLVDMPGVLRSALAMGGVALIAALFAMAMIWSLAGPPEPFIDNLNGQNDVPCAAPLGMASAALLRTTISCLRRTSRSVEVRLGGGQK